MDTPVDDPEYHNNSFMVAVAKHIGLDPSKVSAMSITGNGKDEPITITWEGFAVMEQDEFTDILATVDLTKITPTMLDPE